MNTPPNNAGGPGRPPPTASTPPSFLGSLASLTNAMALSVWQAMRGRPRFVHIADTPFYWRAHITAFCLITLATADFQHRPWQDAVVRVAFHCAFFVFGSYFLFAGKTKSCVLAANILASFAGWQFVQTVALKTTEILGVQSVETNIFLMLAVAWGSVCSIRAIARAFNTLPSIIKKRGYQPASENQFTWSRHD